MFLSIFLYWTDNSGHDLLAFYDYLVKCIREKDDQTLIFFEPVPYAIFFPFVNGIPGTGIQRVPGSLEDGVAKKKACYLTIITVGCYKHHPREICHPGKNLSVTTFSCNMHSRI
ncbi:unnamed protein product [Heterobilharzia americana]|nr:unnamed protein product [Heterobilharzia americana]